jgi:murein DD-endopeptidase MepM/ murein hydrolase activator NlpD
MNVQSTTEQVYVPESNPKNNRGLIIAVVVTLALILTAVVLLFASSNSSTNTNTTQNPQNLNESTNTNPDNNGTTQDTNNNQAVTEDEPPLLLKSIGFNLEAYNESTQTAGDIKFTNITLPFDQIYSPYGQPDPRPGNSGMINPQPTVILPLGTEVQAIVDGVIVEVKELYSGDWTVWIAKSNSSQWFYEIEHVKNPTVQKGDAVVAGEIIGEVSDYDSRNNPGFGLVEIGILHSKSGGAPEHVCPYNYLDSSIKNSVNSNLTKLYDAWEEYLGKDIYDQENFVSPGCVTLEAAQG